jgi:small subunit ribosomal protein S16
MLVIRMQRTGRRGHAQFRVVVQDARRTPTSGNIVASLGHFDPHTKTSVLAKDKAKFYLDHGARPSDRAARLLKSEGVKLPEWFAFEPKRSGKTRNPDKGKQATTAAEAPVDKPAEAAQQPTLETPAATAEPETVTGEVANETPAEPEAEPAPSDEQPTEES